jgi:Mn2+/Fe2+ NRAMP family transporter
LIISGAIVGSGELIATTALGAKVGFVALWLILFSCVIKVVVLEELGRYTISSGETTFSQIYTVTLGSGALALFLAGAFALYSSVASLQKL